ncbi:uncharacterized protein LOC141717439 [Apium graveolens]|uniref:uncharacterized protein LOC141717439 n=1 Tax=Apium graveolens TaxID=4045 RepID=UPI003D79F121
MDDKPEFSDRMSGILKVLNFCMNKDLYDKAIDIVEKEVNNENTDLRLEEKAELFEKLGILYNLKSDGNDYEKEFKAIRDCMTLKGGSREFKYHTSLIILGDEFRWKGELDNALDAYRQGLREFKKYSDLFLAPIDAVEAEKKAAVEATSRLKLQEDLIVDEEKIKKRNEDRMRRIKEKEKKQSGRSMEEKIDKAEESTCGSEFGVNAGVSHPALFEWERQEFNAPFSFILNTRFGGNCYIGSLQSELVKLEKSFVEASPIHISNLDNLISLDRMHVSLLNVEHLVILPTDKSKLLVTEVVYPLEDYFLNEYEKFQPSKKENFTWWDYISGSYWRIFRDITKGLMFLYEKTGDACGDLAFNSFVTSEGRGRILPTLDNSKKGREDVKQLINLMSSVLYNPTKGISDTAHLKSVPSDLTKQLDFLPLYLDLPASFLVDFSYLWTDDEKFAFARKFKELVKKSTRNSIYVDWGMRAKLEFKEWHKVLDGVYLEVYNFAQTKHAASYREKVDIARFINASYAHVNDKAYKKDRVAQKPHRGEKWTEKEIESDLVSYWPNYYVTVHECLCISVQGGQLPADELKHISSTCFRNDDQ